MNRANTRILRAAVTVMLTAGLAAGAFAYWTGTGSGSATTVLPNVQQLTLTAGEPEQRLIPGNVSTIDIDVTNPNITYVDIHALVLDTAAGTGGFDVDSGHAGCDLSALHVARQTNGGAGWRVPPRVGSVDGAQSLDLIGALAMDTSAADACQGARFTVHLKAGA